MSIFSDIAGDDQLKNIDSRIEDLFNKIPNDSEEFTSAEDLTSDVVDSIIGDTNESEMAQLFENISIPHERIQRYGVYTELNRAVPIIKRIIRVYVTNILQKNPVDGKCILFKEQMTEDKDKQKIKTVKKYSQEIVKQFNLVYKFKNRIVPLMLLYGDSFIEIIDVKEKEKEFKLKDINYDSYLTETKTLYNDVINFKTNQDNNLFKQKKIESFYEQFANILVEEQIDNFDDENTEGKNFSNILLRIHKPHNIISLTNNYGTCIGYLEINKASDSTGSVTDVSQMLSQTVGKLTQNIGLNNNLNQDDILNKIIHHVIKMLLKKSKASDNVSSDMDSIIKNMDENVYAFLKRMIIEQGLNEKSKKKFNRLTTKFIKNKNMINFQIPSSDNFPYGGSIVEPLVFPGKLYILSQLSNVITKLSRAALVRTWTIDVGNTQMQSGQIQKLKRELYNSRVTIDDLSSFKSIPKILSD